MTNKRKPFLKAIETILLHEGGYVNDQDDPGGETKYGITKRTYPDIDIKSLTKEQAVEIYYNDWWLKYQYDQIENENVSIKVFDTAINTGNKTAIKLLQKSINFIKPCPISVDGIMGKQTLTSLNKLSDELVLQAYRLYQKKYYQDLIDRKPSLKKYRNGWMNRANS